jgi:hypothetical protein
MDRGIGDPGDHGAAHAPIADEINQYRITFSISGVPIREEVELRVSINQQPLYGPHPFLVSESISW